jgi:hypothetical protein
LLLNAITKLQIEKYALEKNELNVEEKENAETKIREKIM